MSALVLSRHAEARMRQRGMRPSDPGVILRCGSEIGGDALGVYFLKRKDTQREIGRRNVEIQRLERTPGLRAPMDREREVHRLKREIHVLERLGGRKLVVAGETVITCYRPGRRTRKRMLRNDRESA